MNPFVSAGLITGQVGALDILTSMCSVASTAEVTNLVVAVGAVTGHHWPRPKVDHPELVLPMTTGGCVDLTALRDYMMGDNSHNRPLVRAWCSGLCPASKIKQRSWNMQLFFSWFLW